MTSKLLCFFLLLGFSIRGYGQAVSMVRDVTNIVALKALNVLSPHTSVSVKGYVLPGDGGGGIFDYQSTNTAIPDGGIVISPNIGAGNYVRRHDGTDYQALWWGPLRTNATMQAAIDYVSANGHGRVIGSGGEWMVKADDSTRILMKSGVILRMAEDSQLVCAPNPSDNWILIDFPLDIRDFGVQDSRLIGWNLSAPGGDTNKTGVIFSMQDTHNGTFGGNKISNWYSQPYDIGSGNENLQMFDDNWLTGARAFGATGLGPPNDDTKALQSYAHYAERYGREVYLRATTNGYYHTTIYVTNGIPLDIHGDNTLCQIYYLNPDEGIVPRYSAAWVLSSDNNKIHGLNLQTVSTNYPKSGQYSEEQNITGFYVPINIHLGTNNEIFNNTFDVLTGKGIFSSGSYTKIHDNTFKQGCGFSFGVGQRDDWLYYEAPVPFKDGIFRSPVGCSVTDNYFTGSNAWKTIAFFSAAPGLVFERNVMDNISSPNPVMIYSGDAGTTDLNGTNVYELGGSVAGNTITGGNLGQNAAILIRIDTQTNYVQAGFDPSLMYSSVVVRNNKIRGTGNGIETISARRTEMLNNDVEVTGSPFWLVGDTDAILYDGGRYAGTVRGVAGITIPSSIGFLNPANLRNLTIQNLEIVSPPGDETTMRNVEPLVPENFILKHCTIRFHGTNGSPSIFQFTAISNWIKISENTFYITNSMYDRKIGLLTATNGSIEFNKNTTLVMGTNTLIRGPEIWGRDVDVENNDVGAWEIANTKNLRFLHNESKFASPTRPTVQILTTDNAIIIGNTSENLYTNAQAAFWISVSNSVLMGNTVIGGPNSGALVVAADYGLMLSMHNVIRNTGGGPLYPVATGAARVSNEVLQRPLLVEVQTDPVFEIHRSGGAARFSMRINEVYNSSNRDIQYWVIPDSGSDVGGHAFFINDATLGTNRFGFGMSGENRFYIGYLSTNGTDLLNITGGGAGAAGIARIHLETTNGVGNRDAELVLQVDTSSTTDPAGSIHFRAQDLSGNLQDFAVINALANDYGFTKRGGLRIFTTDVSGNMLQAAAFNFLQDLWLAHNLILTNGNVSVLDDIYDATTWNGNTNVPTKNAVRDKIEAIGAGVGGNWVSVGSTNSSLPGTASVYSLTVTNTINGMTVPSTTDTVVGKATTDILTHKTFDAAGAGNIIKFKRYLKFSFPRRIDGVGCTYPNTNDFTASGFMVPRFSGSTATNANWCRFGIRVPKDFDTSVVPTASLTVRLTGADTGQHIYNVGFANVASSAPLTGATAGTWIRMTVAADASGASDDAESVEDVALSGWNSGMNPGQWLLIELNRAGAVDASTVASDLEELTIEYGVIQ